MQLAEALRFSIHALRANPRHHKPGGGLGGKLLKHVYGGLHGGPGSGFLPSAQKADRNQSRSHEK